MDWGAYLKSVLGAPGEGVSRGGSLLGVDKGFNTAAAGAREASEQARQFSDTQWNRQMQGLQGALGQLGGYRSLYDDIYGTKTAGPPPGMGTGGQPLTGPGGKFGGLMPGTNPLTNPAGTITGQVPKLTGAGTYLAPPGLGTGGPQVRPGPGVNPYQALATAAGIGPAQPGQPPPLPQTTPSHMQRAQAGMAGRRAGLL